jgi:hypothetical protein
LGSTKQPNFCGATLKNSGGARAGVIPGAKVGRAWVFLEDDLAAYLRSRYPQLRQALQVTLRKETECHFANAAVPGGSTSSPLPENEYVNLLKLPIKPKRKSFTTDSSPISGESRN